MVLNAPKSREEIQGFEFDWLASDVGGFVALFSTAGAGDVPNAFLQDTGAHETAIDAVLALPASTQARFAPTIGPNLVNTWRLVAERGLYAFDCDPSGGPYRLVAAPTVAVPIANLPSIVAEVARRICLPLRFETDVIILADALTAL